MISRQGTAEMATNQEELGKSPCMKGIIHTTPQYTGKARRALQNSLVWCLLGLQFNEIQPFKISIYQRPGQPIR